MVSDGRNFDPDWPLLSEVLKNTRLTNNDIIILTYQVGGTLRGKRLKEFNFFLMLRKSM